MWKDCSCNIQWEDSVAFLEDPNIKFVGMQINLKSSKYKCFYYFDHTVCGTTLGVKINKFESMIEKPVPKFIMTGEDECPRYCSELNNFLECTNDCHNAPYRRFAIKILSNLN